MNSNHKIYLGLTTTGQSGWREKIDEIKTLGLKEIALFPTVLEKDERHQLYKSLLDTPIKHIPFVHLRHDSTLDEVEFFAKNYKTRLFNLHSADIKNNLFENFPSRHEQLFIENTSEITSEFLRLVNKSAGICLDFAHWEDYGVKQKEPTYKGFAEIVRTNRVGFAHLTSVRDKSYQRDYGRFSKFRFHYSAHCMEKLDDYNYLKKYREFLPEIMGIETENTLKEQLEIKKYIEKLI